MYKTVRHGESSLQYTILPQDADSAAACTVTKHTTSSGRTAVLIAICVVLVGGVVAAVVVPLLVSTRLVLPAPHRRIAALPEHNTVSTSTPSTRSASTATSEPVVNISTTVSSSSETPSTAGTTPTQTEPTTLFPSVRVWSAVQVTTTTHSTTTTTLAPVLTTTSPPPTTVATPTEADTQTVSSSSSSSPPDGAVTTSRPHKSWLPSRWPFVDPANTYAQWTELARQSALVPAACLGALVLAVIIALGACLATRRRRQKAHRRRTIGKMSSELQQGDKTTLLTEVSEAED